MWEYNHSDELYHWGIKGMKWGVRRYRNEDGTLTDAGKKRYSDEPVHEDYAKAHDDKRVETMSDAELRARNNRLQMERQYAQMTQKTNRGKKVVQAFIAGGALTAGVITAIGQYKAAADKVKGFVSVELNMGQMIEDVRLATGCKKPVGLCNRAGGMIPSPEEVLESLRKAQKGVY